MAVRASLVGLSRRAFSTMIPENEMRRKLSHSTFIGISRRNFSTQKTQASSEMFNLNIVSNVVGEEPKLKKKNWTSSSRSKLGVCRGDVGWRGEEISINLARK